MHQIETPGIYPYKTTPLQGRGVAYSIEFFIYIRSGVGSMFIGGGRYKFHEGA